MLLDFLFIKGLTGVEAPNGDQVLGINMSSQNGEHRHFDSYTREPRLHLTPASHLLSRSAPVLTQCEAQSRSRSSVYTCPSHTTTHCDGEKRERLRIKKIRQRGSCKNKKLMEISCGEAGVE